MRAEEPMRQILLRPEQKGIYQRPDAGPARLPGVEFPFRIEAMKTAGLGAPLGRLLALAVLIALAVLLAASFSACGRARETASYEYAEQPALQAEEHGREAPAARRSEAVGDEAGLSGTSPPASPAEEAEALLAAAVPQQAETRKRIYSGYCRLLVPDIEESKRELIVFAETSGGYVESAYENSIVLRVPAEHFRNLFEAILDKGEPVYKSVETYDVGDYFRDQETRLRIAERARSRLYTLLERSEDVEERLQVLREIKRLSEEIESIRLRLQALERQIAFSRITVELVPRLPVGQMDREVIPFPWIASLDPVYGSLPRLKGRAGLPLGEDFAVLERRRAFRAESPEGTRVRVGSVRNQPQGDELFWQRALVHHLGSFYRSAEAVEIGALRGVLFGSKDRTPFFYLVAVQATGRNLYVVEVFFPNPESRDKRLETLKEAIRAFEVKWRPW